MLTRAADALALTLLATWGCGAQPDAHEAPRARSLATGPALYDSRDYAATRSETDCPSASAQTPQTSGAAIWLKTSGGPEISGLARDAAGRVWLTQSGMQTALLSAEGALLWSVPFGSRVALLHRPEAYVTGSFSGSALVGSFSLTAQGGRDVYVAKLSDTGEVLQAFALGGPGDDDVQSLSVDSHDNLIVSGPGIGTQKLDPTGALLWQKPFSGSIAVDSADAVLLTGALSEDIDFGGGALHSRGGADVVVVKLSPNGEHVFSRNFGDAGEQQQGEAIAVDASDNVLVAGTFDGVLDFGVGALTKPNDACSSDAWCATFGFVTKFDAQGAAAWSVSLGPMRELNGATTTANGALVLSGVLPGGVRPFRQPWLAAFGADGARLWQRAEWPETGIGAGSALSGAGCDRVIWGVSARPSFEEEEQSYVAAIGL